MNQQIADAVRALPAPLKDTYILGWLCLALCWLSYVYYLRPTLWRILNARLSPRVINEQLTGRLSRIFFNRVYQKAHLESCGYFTVNRILLPALCFVTLCHGVMTVLQLSLPSPPPVLCILDRALLSLLFFAVALISLMTQPRATIERRERWGFRPVGNIVHAVLWEAVIVLVLFLWLYVAYFLTML